MKTKSKSPKKQRLARYTADLHEKGKFLSVHLTKELKEKHGKRNIRVRKGDKVKVLRGNFKGKTGAISSVDVKREIVFIEGIEVIKRDGTKVRKSFRPSNLIITSLYLEDKKRKNKLTISTDKSKTKIIKENKND